MLVDGKSGWLPRLRFWKVFVGGDDEIDNHVWWLNYIPLYPPKLMCLSTGFPTSIWQFNITMDRLWITN